MRLKKARTIKKALKNFDPNKPLWDDKERTAFYVSRDNSPLEEMQRLLVQAISYPKLLLSGPPGCGKSTELAKLKEFLGKKFHIVLFSAKEISNDFKVTPEAVLFSIIRKIGEIARQKNLSIYKNRVKNLIERIQGWETKIAELDTDGKKIDLGMFEKLQKGELDLKGQFKHISKTFTRPTVNEVIVVINETAKELEKRRFIILRGKPVLLLVSDMDKFEIESARDLFIKSFLHLTKINCYAVYTFPLELKYDQNFVKMYRNFSGVYFLQNFKIFNEQDEIDESGKEKLREVINKRMSSNISYYNVIDQIIEHSGGILFELINLVRQCCIIALREQINYIDEAILKEAEERIRNIYKLSISGEDLNILNKIRQDKKIPVIADFSRLLNQFSVTEYGNGKNVWYNVNPILFPILINNECDEE